MRNAQCTGAQQVRDISRQLALLFIQSQEYANRNRSNSQFVEDLYDAVLRRGPELGGFNFWLGQLDSGLSRPAALDAFVDSPEFQGRVQSIIDAGCM
jgi:serralysin